MDTNQTHETSTPDADNCGALRTKSGQEIQTAERPTPETDTLYNPENGWTGVVPINHARRALHERNEAREQRDRLAEALNHCRLFIVDRKGYIADESLERESLKQKIDETLAAVKGGTQ